MGIWVNRLAEILRAASLQIAQVASTLLAFYVYGGVISMHTHHDSTSFREGIVGFVLPLRDPLSTKAQNYIWSDAGAAAGPPPVDGQRLVATATGAHGFPPVLDVLRDGRQAPELPA